MTYYERNLPHWHPPGRAIFLTWRLHGSLPSSFLARLRERKGDDPGRIFRAMDKQLDTTTAGPRWLSDSRIAKIVAEQLVSGQNAPAGYLLHAFAVMPNHVHALVTPKVGLSAITKQWKGATARRANLILGRKGRPFWQNECFDHWARNPAQCERIRSYIEWNPVRARLIERPEDWPWSSANAEWRAFISDGTG